MEESGVLVEDDCDALLLVTTTTRGELDTELLEDLWLEVRESGTDVELLCTPVQAPKPSWQPRDALQWFAVFPHQL